MNSRPIPGPRWAIFARVYTCLVRASSLCAGWCGVSACRVMFLLAAFAGTDLKAQQADVSARNWQAQPYRYLVLDQDIRDTLTDFGRNLGLPITLTEAVQGRVRGQIQAATAGEFLDALARSNGLVWYFDGSILNISSDSELQTRVVPTAAGGGQLVVQEIERLGLRDPRFALRVSGDGSVITVSGPPAYIATVGQVATAIQPEPLADRDDPRVRVFRGGRNLEIATVPEVVGGGP